MKNFDDLNFECRKCGSVFYRDSSTRENYLITRGHKTCPVCGRVAVQQGNGWICLHCLAKYIKFEVGPDQ